MCIHEQKSHKTLVRISDRDRVRDLDMDRDRDRDKNKDCDRDRDRVIDRDSGRLRRISLEDRTHHFYRGLFSLVDVRVKARV